MLDPPVLVGEREESPLSWHTLQGVLPAILKERIRSDDDVLHRTGHQDVTRAGQSLDARGDVHRHPRQRASLQLAFARVYPDPDVDTEALHGLSRRPGTVERARRGIEAYKEPVAGGVDLDAFAPRDLGTHGIVMLREHGPPAAITQAPGMLGGPDDVGEEQRCEDALHLAHRLSLTLRSVDELRETVGGRGQLAVRVVHVDVGDDETSTTDHASCLGTQESAVGRNRPEEGCRVSKAGKRLAGTGGEAARGARGQSGP